MPFVDVEPVHSPSFCLPAGDDCIVYPGSSGPLDSIRFEALRDALGDYELDPKAFRKARSELLAAFR